MLPALLPGAIAWAEARAGEVLTKGAALDEAGTAIARCVGVKEPQRIRVALVTSLPLPEDPMLCAAALQTGLLGPGMAALTLGHAILVCEGHLTPRLLSHECRHVYQYEQYGSIAAFLPVYLEQIVEVGYEQAPFERDARNAELSDVGGVGGENAIRAAE